MAQTMLLFDMQSATFGTPVAELYPAALEMARFADKAGVDSILCAEHHASETNYLPQPAVLGGAVAAVTERAKIVLMSILPLHDPVEAAESIAVLDLISQGRLEVILGVGYVPAEFELFGVPMNKRGKVYEEQLELVIRALKGEQFEAMGRKVFVSPRPFQRPIPTLYVAGGTEIAVQRAARLGVSFSPLKPELFALYDEECRKLGREPGKKLSFGGPMSVYVSNDPEADWAKIEPYVANTLGAYMKFATSAVEAGKAPGSNYAEFDKADLRKSGKHLVLTPDECVKLANDLAKNHQRFIVQPLVGGLSPDEGWKSLELFAKEVLPKLGKTAVS